MGPYCQYCDHRCFVLRRLPDGHKCSAICDEVGHTLLLATCAQGMERDRQLTGFDHTTAINPHEVKA